MEVHEFESTINDLALEDYRNILRYAKKFEKIILPQKDKIKIAVLGSCSIQYFVQVLRMMLYREGICADIYEGEYNGIEMDILNEKSDLYLFRPQLAIILSDFRDLKEMPEYFEPQEAVEKYLKHYDEYYLNLWNTLREKLPDCHIFQTNFVIPVERALGNLEANYTFSSQYIYKRLNDHFVEIHPQFVTIIDLDYLASLFGKINWFDNSLYVLSKVPFALQYIGYVSDLFVKLITAWLGHVRKCIVLDLDNTLWGGVVSEEGCTGVNIDPNDAEGETYWLFQKYLKVLKSRGILLAVCSKNDLEIAKEPFIKNRNMVLQLSDFAAFKANWNDKADNIIQIAEELNIGVDSLVFFDDNPAEREIVKMMLPKVKVIDVPADPAYYVRALELSRVFEWLQLTREDCHRAETYEKNKQRVELEKVSANYDDYLQALQMHAKISSVSCDTIKRFTQLINKSNQFNLRTRRYLDSYIENIALKEDYKLLTVQLTDKFSDYGIIACVILKKIGQKCVIDTWVMSCRVLKRGLEYWIFQHIYDYACNWKCEAVYGEYIPTPKNSMVKNLYQELGFELHNETDMKTTSDSQVYCYQLGTIPKYKIFIQED